MYPTFRSKCQHHLPLHCRAWRSVKVRLRDLGSRAAARARRSGRRRGRSQCADPTAPLGTCSLGAFSVPPRHAPPLPAPPRTLAEGSWPGACAPLAPGGLFPRHLFGLRETGSDAKPEGVGRGWGQAINSRLGANIPQRASASACGGCGGSGWRGCLCE